MTDDLVSRAVARDDAAVEALAGLAGSDPSALTPSLAGLLAANVSWRPVLFRGADDAVRRQIVARVDAGAGARLHHLLQALAHAGGPIAEAAFRRWAEQPPPDAGLLFLGPADYPPMGGWSVEPDGVRRLCGETALDLLPAGAAEPAEGRCPWCASPLWAALDLDTADPRVAEALSHTGWAGRLRIVTCHSCACHGPVLCEVAADGSARWSDRNHEPEFLSLTRCDPPDRRLVPGDRRDSPYPADQADQGMATGGGSSLGGFPGRLPASGHPACPACARAMAYIATVSTADASGPAATPGTGDRTVQRYAFFLDAGCGLAAVRQAGDQETSVPAPGPDLSHGHGHGHAPAATGAAPVALPFPRVRPPTTD